VRRFTIDSSIIGTDKHIVGDSDGYYLTDSVPRDSWHLTGELKTSSTVKCLDTLHRLVGKNLPHVPDKYITAMRCLVTGSQQINVPWKYALPQDVFRIFFKNIVQETTSSFDKLPFDYYETAWSAGSRVLNSLKPAAVDLEVLQRHISTAGNSAPGLESFRPKRSGFAHPVEYDRFATRTGRLTVVEGPNILVLKKSCRDILKSSFEDGKVVSLDFRALEARIVLAEADRYSIHEDIYDEISQKQFKGIIPRDIVKVAVLSDLYGISRGALKARLGVTDQKLDSFIGVIRDYFRVEDLRSRLKVQVGSSGKMNNRFGRPLQIPEGQDNLLVNTYAQSSGVDVSMLGFDKILSQLGSDGVRPLFVLHDAIILDVRGDRLDEVSKITDVSIPTYQKPFPLKFELMTNS
jgi:hypothetical protein